MVNVSGKEPAKYICQKQKSCKIYLSERKIYLSEGKIYLSERTKTLQIANLDQLNTFDVLVSLQMVSGEISLMMMI